MNRLFALFAPIFALSLLAGAPVRAQVPPPPAPAPTATPVPAAAPTPVKAAKKPRKPRTSKKTDTPAPPEAAATPTAAPADAAVPTPTASPKAKTTRRTKNTDKMTAPASAPSVPGQVWVNTASGVYHMPGTKWYGKTKEGVYMSEADALKKNYKKSKSKTFGGENGKPL